MKNFQNSLNFEGEVRWASRIQDVISGATDLVSTIDDRSQFRIMSADQTDIHPDGDSIPGMPCLVRTGH